MGRAEIHSLIVSSLHHFIGAEETEIDGDTRPIGDLGLDSPDGIDYACDLEQLGFSLPRRLNPFWDDGEDRPRTVDEIVDLVLEYSDSPARRNHA